MHALERITRQSFMQLPLAMLLPDAEVANLIRLREKKWEISLTNLVYNDPRYASALEDEKKVERR